ncbi:hypothetical protein ACWD3I_25740 [Streptomyces sp. NPDC002817]|uniref:hypothetical protein n=1 Tax=Streptomyces sp. NPDC088357 TaxID=3154655 RepID=UPI003446EA2D
MPESRRSVTSPCPIGIAGLLPIRSPPTENKDPMLTNPSISCSRRQRADLMGMFTPGPDSSSRLRGERFTAVHVIDGAHHVQVGHVGKGSTT